MAWVATAIVGSAVIGGVASAYSANKAASAQKDAANSAIATQQQQYAQTREDLAPYRDSGTGALTQLNSQLPYLTSPINVDAQLNDPNSIASKAYGFTKDQGLKAVQNSAAARGLGVSGAAQKGAASYVTGLANNTYKDLFNMENTSRQSAYDRLMGLVNTGESAAAGTVAAGQKTADSVSSAQIGQGNAQAAADNKTGSAISGVANTIGGIAAYKGLYGNGSGLNANGSISGAVGPTSVGGAPLIGY